MVCVWVGFKERLRKRAGKEAETEKKKESGQKEGRAGN